MSDGRIIAVPLAWFPRLLHATPEQRHRVEISLNGLHWGDLDEDISVAGLLAGARVDGRHDGAVVNALDEHESYESRPGPVFLWPGVWNS